MDKGVRWRIATAGLLGIALLTVYISDAVGPLLEWPTQLTANITGGIIQLFGIDAVQDGTVIFRPYGFAYEIYYRCIGVLPASALTIAILASPAGLRAKFIGLAIGIPLVLLVNLIRLVHLFVLGVDHPDYFWIAHRVLWEAAMLGLTLLIWVAWMRWSFRWQCVEPNACGGSQ